ncbi:MAG TPA: FHA domain-containing protein [Pseudomonadota bacterium]|jgi:predicted component of type VI protein secretion system|nr:FHA domain-containing protein [Rhodanobacteraceae bacterium]MBP9153794.1 FHA domain-containing protein [Xanthomonadales bacterium]HQW82624.1 FHA domain-containing protein [Pseudomonadota bacterium]
MLRILFRYLTGSKAGTVEVYPAAKFRALYVGRDPGCDLRFHAEQDGVVSRNHAVIEWQWAEGEAPRFAVSDLLSSNGTYVNGERVGQAAPLTSGDHIRFGHGGPEAVFLVDQVEAAASDGEEWPARVGSTSQIPALQIDATVLRGRLKR